jgi:hypothetical protein
MIKKGKEIKIEYMFYIKNLIVMVYFRTLLEINSAILINKMGFLLGLAAIEAPEYEEGLDPSEKTSQYSVLSQLDRSLQACLRVFIPLKSP